MGGARAAAERVGRWRARLRHAVSEPGLAEFCAAFVDRPGSSSGFVLAHPVASLMAVVASSRLPSHAARLSGHGEGPVIAAMIGRRTGLGVSLGRTAVASLTVPPVAADYAAGASRQTLRRKARAAVRAGVTCRSVTDVAEKVELVALAEATERSHPDPQYRTERPDLRGLLDLRTWVLAQTADGRPIALAVVAVDGEWSLLEYFRTLEHTRTSSDARYLLTQALVERLSAAGVAHLVDGRHPLGLPNGLRHFQRMVGYRMVRIVVRTPVPVRR